MARGQIVLIPTLRRALVAGTMLTGVCWCFGTEDARAQLGTLLNAGSSAAPISRDAPVTFEADNVEYQRDGALVVASGHVEAWQNDRVLRADRVTFDRNTNVAAASGHVVLLEPDGQVLFSEYAELTQGMRNGILRDMRALLAENGKLAANGARRVEGQENELSRVIYSTCNVCAQHPDRPPLWDIRARSAVQDLVNKRIDYSDAVIDLGGLPVAYFPYLSQADPSQKRASGFLVPSFGQSSHLGAFVSVPYYWVIDAQSDATIAPLIATKAGPGLDVQYRVRLNEGTILVNSSLAYDQSALQGDIFAKGSFAYNDEWRYGFDIERASSATYLQDYKIAGYSAATVLSSNVYLEGFGQGSYTRIDARAYQGLTSSVITSELPYVAPRYEYSFVGEPDALGGRLSVDAGAFNVLRDVGTSTQRASLSANWERPATGAFGDLYKLILHVDSAAYDAQQFNEQPNYGGQDSVQSAQGMPTAAVNMNWPFQHDGDWGTQVIEPIAQVVGAPNGSSYQVNLNRIPNEDSLDPDDFTDSNLFAINRFPGIDRLEGGLRANVAMHGNWSFDSTSVDAFIGEGFREKPDKAFAAGSGLTGTATDVVTHFNVTPGRYFDLTSHQRFDHKTWDLTFADAIASAGPEFFRVNAGYLYSPYTPYLYYVTQPTTNTLPGPPRNEISIGANAKYGSWRVAASARKDIQTGKMVSLAANAAYEDECFIFNVQYARRYTSINGDTGSSTLLFTVTLKTVGQFGFHAS